MCFGGGEAATITMPDTSAYDQQADLQIALMKLQMQQKLLKSQNKDCINHFYHHL